MRTIYERLGIWEVEDSFAGRLIQNCIEMNIVQKAFLSLLRDHLHSSKSNTPEELDWVELERLASIHEVSGIIYHQLRGNERCNAFLAKYSSSIFYYVNRNSAFYNLICEFKSHYIPYAVVKGQAIAPLYPLPPLRTMGDIDLLVNLKDQSQIRQIMARLGYEELPTGGNMELDFKNEFIEIEMHSLLVYPDEQVEQKRYMEFFNNFWPYVDEKGQLKKEFHLLYLLVHLRKHLLNHGAGVRQFMDVGVFTRAYREQMDWEWISEKLDYLQLKRFAEVVYTFIHRWFDVETPFEAGDISEEIYEASTIRILQNGVFGFQSADDESALMSYCEAKHGFWGHMVYRIRIVFPAYNTLRGMRKYSFIDGKPFLLPLAWIYRIIYTLIQRRERISILRNGKTDKGRIDMIKVWGM